jgi:two-component sensor histidine kinase
LREADHRVNNNMQMVSSLLQLQANYIEDPKLLESFQECTDRIRTMSLIHQKLRRKGAWAQIDFKEYLETLTDMLVRAKSKGVKVRRQFDMEPVALSLETAIPLGLIANELISNSLKHGFAGRQEGLVRVSLSRRGGDQLRLAIGDDGCGVAAGISEGGSLGMRLVKVLTGQIRGQMEYKNENGAEFVIVFKDTSSNST